MEGVSNAEDGIMFQSVNLRLGKIRAEILEESGVRQDKNRYWVICKTKRERTTSVESRRRDSRLEIEVELVVVPKSCDA